MIRQPFERLDLHYYELAPSPGLAGWLSAQGVSLAITTGEDVFMLGVDRDGAFATESTEIDRCTALALADSETMMLATRYQIWMLANAALPGERVDGHFDRLYIPQSACTTGALGISSMVVESSGRAVFVNSLFNCIATTDERKSFRPLWRPSWIGALAPGDCCRLSGIAARDGRAAYVTSYSTTAEPGGWLAHRIGGGVVVDLQSGALIAGGLSMPHAPRWHNGQLWLINAGTGELGVLDLGRGAFEPIMRCPGFARALALVGNYALLGISRAAPADLVEGLDLPYMRMSGDDVRSGLLVVDLTTGQVVERMLLYGSRVREVLDIVTIPGVSCPAMLHTSGEAIQQTVTIGPLRDSESS
jgi:uncharacterized protein (TIGR03032 family)